MKRSMALKKIRSNAKFRMNDVSPKKKIGSGRKQKLTKMSEEALEKYNEDMIEKYLSYTQSPQKTLMVNREGLYSIHNYEDVLDELNKGMQLIIIPERDVLTLKIILDEYKNKVDDEEIFETFNFTSTDIKEWNTIKEIPWGKITADERGARERKIVLDKLKNDKGAKKNFPDVILAVNER